MHDASGHEPGGNGEIGVPGGGEPPGHRLPDGTRLGPVTLQVSDLERSVAYYRTVMGLQVAPSSAGRVTLAAEGDDAPLIELVERPGARPVPRRGLIGLYHFALLLPERAALGRFVRHLADAGVRAGASDHRVSEAIYLHDPDGLGIEVYADRPRAAWRYENGQLVMATDPLDTDALIRAGDGGAWTGMPSGTVIGHVHLHVADLARAAAFYQVGLGFDRTVWSYPGALFLSAGGYHHHLGLNTWAAGARPAAHDDARLLEWQIRLPTAADVRSALESAAAAGHPADLGESGVRPGNPGSPPPDAEAGGVLRDPWGTAVRIRSGVG